MDPTTPFTINDDWDVECVEGCEFLEHFFNGEIVTRACRWCGKVVSQNNGIVL